MPESIRSIVAARAEYRCEYCRLRAEDDVFTVHVEHIIALKHGGSDELGNRAFACQSCNLHKGSNISGIDFETRAMVPLFHPRRNRWEEHFSIHAFRFIGITPVRRATVAVLCMNGDDRVRMRMMIAARSK